MIDCEYLALAIVERAKYTRTRGKFRGDTTRRERQKLIFGALFSKFRVRVCGYFARPTFAMAKIRDYSQSINDDF